VDESDSAAAAPRLRLRGSTSWILEAVALLVVIGLVFAKLASVAGGSWRAVFLANGDSLVLPLVLQSLQRGEPFHWVFSSQTFLFPEFPLSAICGLIMGSPQGGLVLNAILNVVLLYLGFRAIAAAFLPGWRVRQLAVALGGVVLFLIGVLSEVDVRIFGAGTVEPDRIATVFLMTTYYGGALLVSLGMLALVVWSTGRLGATSVGVRRTAIAAVVAAVVGAAVTYSDPLYLFWFVAPLGIVLLLLLILRRLTLRAALIVAFPQILGLGLGMLARAVFSQYIGAGYDNYITGTLAKSAAALLLGVLGDWVSTPGGILRLLIFVGLLAVTVVFLVEAGRRRAGPRAARAGTAPTSTAPTSTAELFLALFVLVSAVTLIGGEIATGQGVTRYLLPLFVFPPLALLLVRPEWLPARLRVVPARAVAVAVGLVTAAMIVTFGVTAPAVADLASRRSPVDTACLDGWLDGRAENGIGSFWVVRSLALYGDQKGRLLQVTPFPIGVHFWMNNLWLYEGTSFSYALAGGDLSAHDLRRSFGEPAQVIRCSGYQILDYAGTAGAAAIDAMVRTTLVTASLHHRF
jgi:hypothetical protein